MCIFKTDNLYKSSLSVLVKNIQYKHDSGYIFWTFPIRGKQTKTVFYVKHLINDHKFDEKLQT